MEQLKLKDIEDVDNILRSLESMDTDTLKNTLAYLLKVYIVDKELAYSGSVIDSRSVPHEVGRSGEAPANFTELMTDLKRNYSMEELKKFSVEGGKVFITLNNKRYQISSEEAPAPIEPGPLRKEPVQNTPPPVNRNSSGSVDRFRNLELDD